MALFSLTHSDVRRRASTRQRTEFFKVIINLYRSKIALSIFLSSRPSKIWQSPAWAGPFLYYTHTRYTFLL